MERKAIYFNGDVSTEELRSFVKTIPKDSGVTDIVIGGSLIGTDKDANKIFRIPVSLWVDGEIEMLGELSTLRVKGDLHSTDVIDAWKISVTGNFTCDSDMDISSAKVGKDLICQGNMNANGNDVMVSGDFICYGDKCCANVLYGGEFICEGEFTGEAVKA